MPLPNLVWSVNNRYLGTGSSIGLDSSLGGGGIISWNKASNPNMADVWYKFKTFMVDNGWTVTKSGVGWSDQDQLNYNGDMFSNIANSSKLFNMSLLYFVLQDPNSKRELLFYRSPESAKQSLVNDPFTMTNKNFFTEERKSFANMTPTITPIFQQLRASTDLYTGVSCVDNGDGTITLNNVYIPDSTVYPSNPIYNQYLSSNMVGRYISLFPPTDNSSSPTTFFLPTSQIISVLGNNSLKISGSIAGGLTHAGLSFCITDTGAMIGNSASVINNARISIISGLINMTNNSVGHTLKLKKYNGVGVNDGEFLIVDVVNATQVKVINVDGSTFSNSADNTNLYWKECFQYIDYVPVSQDRMSIAYSAESKFSTYQTLTNTAGYTYTWKVPFAVDMVWASPKEQSLPPITTANLVNYPAIGDGNYFLDSINRRITQSTYWNLHMCMSTVDPFPFYFWITYQESNAKAYDLAQKQATINPGSATNSNITIDNTIPYRYDSLSFFAMDSLDDTATGDNDSVVFWCDVSGGAPSHKTGNYAGTMSNINELLSPGLSTPSTLYSIRSWYKKPASFVDRNDFLNQFNQMKCGFLPTAVLMYQGIQLYESGTSRRMVTLIPGNLSTNTYSSNDEIYPMMYARGSNFYTAKVNNQPQDNASIKEPFKLPTSYKGVSTFMKVAGNTRSNCDLLNDAADPSGQYKWILAGRFSIVCLPWDGVSLPNID